jgi:hypothetical protein
MTKNKIHLAALVCLMHIHFFAKAQPQVFTLPYHNDFETDTIGWYSDTLNGGEFQWVPSGTGTCMGNTGLEISALTQPNAYPTLYSPIFDLTNSSNPVLCIAHFFNNQLNVEGVRMEYSENGGVWNLLGGFAQGTYWYNSPSVVSSLLPAWTGTSTGCQWSSLQGVFLSWLSSVQFRFIQNLDVGTNFYYFLDEFHFCDSSCICTTVGIEEIQTENEIAVFPNPASIEFEIRMDQPIQGDLIISDATGKQVLHEIINEASRKYQANMFAPGLYNIQFVTENTIRTTRLSILK